MQFVSLRKLSVLLPGALLAVMLLASSASAQGPQLFSNQYTQGMSNQATAQMYMAPVPVPAWVGHTYYTYQPLYPHELMQSPHARRYHSYYDYGRGLDRTRVSYRTSAQYQLRGLMNSFSLPRR